MAQVINTIETLQDARQEGVATKPDVMGVKGDMKLLQWGVALIIVVNVVPILTALFAK